MTRRIARCVSHHHRVRLSRPLQAELLGAIGYPHFQAPATLSHHKRPVDEDAENQRYKRPRYVATVEVAVQHPIPQSLDSSRYAAFLRDFVDPVDTVSSYDGDHRSHSRVRHWLASLDDACRERHCRTDSCITTDCLVRPAIARPRSVPTVIASYNYGYAPAPQSTSNIAPPSTARGRALSRGRARGNRGSSNPSSGSTSRSASRSLVETARYRIANLASNGIYLRPRQDTLPPNVADLVDQIIGCRRADSPGLSAHDVAHDQGLPNLTESGVPESGVVGYFELTIFLRPEFSDVLMRNDRMPMFACMVPTNLHKAAQFPISKPVPDMLYGYGEQAFSQPQRMLLLGSADWEGGYANTQNLAFPFLVVEFKGDGPSGAGSLWVATNQCLGGAAACVHMAEGLNQIAGGPAVNSTTFSVALNGSDARLHVSWRQCNGDGDGDVSYCMRTVRTFAVQEPDDFLALRACVRNIIAWGRGARLAAIRQSVDDIMEAERQQKSTEAKAHRPSPPVESETAVTDNSMEDGTGG